MNGALHLGHSFAFSKAEFYTRFQRMLGKNVLLPFGFHCTGMPIQAAADKLRMELKLYGNPPKYPEPAAPEGEVDDAGTTTPDVVEAQKRGGSKSKTQMKTGGLKWQWHILAAMGIPEEEIPKFADPVHWLQYFPPIGMADLQSFGACVDWRRSFITTDVNPYYDSFVRWQFNTLKGKDLFSFGKRNAIWAPQENQPCADHERSSGEGVQPMEYTLIKMRVLEVPESLRGALGDRTLYLVAGTMRPETMSGQTNYWVKPSGDYGVFEISKDTAFVCSDQSARNMSFQDLAVEFGKPVCLARIPGKQLIGVPVSSPLCTYERIYGLPMESILMTKATGIVTSVPSDAPDDWQNLADLKASAELRAQYGIKDEWVLPFDPVSIITVPGLGNMAAQAACQHHGVKSRSDGEALKKAKLDVYQQGFYAGVLLTGPYAGKTVEYAKPLMRKELLASGQAHTYAEPGEEVVSRSGEVCVVALTDQWSLSYGEPSWRDTVIKHVKETLQTFGDECKTNLLATLGWMPAWAVSRTYGMGTRVPWDPTYIIESLSDSTIYMAYYTVCHHLHTDLFGKQVGDAGIAADQMTHAVWDYIFLGKGDVDALPAGLDRAALQKMRAEFLYWYPWDVRCSGRDLIQNHLTMSLYNHAAIFPPEHWPLGIRANGFMLLNDTKMAKSTGNFLTLADAVEKYGADATRFVLARGGDAMTDGNFKEEDANAAVLMFYTLVDWATKVEWSTLRTGEANFFDRVMMNHLNVALVASREQYEKTMFRAAVEVGWISVMNSWKEYVLQVDKAGMDVGLHGDIARAYVKTLAILICPVSPHVAETLWRSCGEQGFAVQAQWPAAVASQPDLPRMEAYLSRLISETRRLIKLAQSKKTVTGVRIFIASAPAPWQQAATEIVTAAKKNDPNVTFADCMKLVNSDKRVQDGGKASKKLLPVVVKEALEGVESFDERALLVPLTALIAKRLEVPTEIHQVGDDGTPKTACKSQPGKPGIDILPEK